MKVSDEGRKKNRKCLSVSDQNISVMEWITVGCKQDEMTFAITEWLVGNFVSFTKLTLIGQSLWCNVTSGKYQWLWCDMHVCGQSKYPLIYTRILSFISKLDNYQGLYSSNIVKKFLSLILQNFLNLKVPKLVVLPSKWEGICIRHKGLLTHYQTTNFRLFQTERVCRQQFQIWRKWQKVIQTGRKHCGKRRNCSLRAISPFPTVFSKGLFPRGINRCHCVGIG